MEQQEDGESSRVEEVSKEENSLREKVTTEEEEVPVAEDSLPSDEPVTENNGAEAPEFAEEGTPEEEMIPLDTVLPGEERNGEAVRGDLLPELEEPEENAEADALKELEELLDEEEPEVEPLFFGTGLLPPVSYDAEVLDSELLPTGFSTPLGREGFRFGLSVFANYDSNVRLLEGDEEDDFFITAAPSVEYRSGPLQGVPGIVTARYSPFLRLYFGDSDFDSVDHSASFSVDYQGTRGTFRADADFARFAESNRFVGDVVNTQSYSLGVSTTYQFTTRSTAELRLGYNLTDFSDATRFDAETISAEATWFWAARPNLRMGPSLRYATRDSDSLGTTDTFSYLVAVDYRPTNIEKLNVSSTIGLETSDGDTGSSNTGFTGSVDLSYEHNERLSSEVSLSFETISQQFRNRFGVTGGGDRRLNGEIRGIYRPNEFWTASTEVGFRSISSPSAAGQSINTYDFRASLARQLQQARITLGGSVEFSEFDGGTRGDETFYSAYLRYSRPLLGASFRSSLQWSQNSGDRDWTRVQVTSGLSFAF